MGQPGIIETHRPVTQDQVATWRLAHEAYPEIEQVARENAAAFLGSAALRSLVEAPDGAEPSNESTLQSMLKRAKEGDLVARAGVKNNVAQDVPERFFKAAHQSSISIDIEQGRFAQANLPLVNVYANFIAHEELNLEMYNRTSSEVGNVFLFEDLNEAGVLEDHYAVVCSLASDNKETRREFNFSEESLTCSIQLLDVKGTTANLKTALFAGRKNPTADRHDYRIIQQASEKFGASFKVSSFGDSVKVVFIIPKTELPNDIDDFVRILDDVDGTFYGEDKPRQDYLAYAAVCRQRNKSYTAMVDAITDDLIAEADTFTRPIDAVRRLNKLSGKYCIEHSITDATIDSRVFGIEAAIHIEQARVFEQQGKAEEAKMQIDLAVEKDKSSSCPAKSVEAEESVKANSENEKDDEKVEVSCPFCEARVKINPCAKVIKCSDCTATVVNGKVISKGNGGTKKRLAEDSLRQEEAMRQLVDTAYQESGVQSFEQEQSKQQPVQMQQPALAGVQ